MASWTTIERTIKKNKIGFKLMKNKLSNDVRDYFFDGVYDIAKKNKNVLFLTSDHTAFSLNKFAKDMPNQFINLGISLPSSFSMFSGINLIPNSRILLLIILLLPP